ncbi:MAG: YigZ family protein [Dysgonamonadaceae bacterium]|nr:YigZ family protein [Dysgonamonadaceae bacterium]
MTDVYKTISAISEGYITEQRSKFISCALPVRTPEEVKEKVDAFRKQYYDARHICWAYMLGADRMQFRVHDDGEPSSTAGKPVLGVINSHGLTDILIIVVRYFGGVKLGTGGLIAAYRAAAQNAVAHAEITLKTVDEDITVSFEYPFLNSVMKIVKDDNPLIVSQKFGMDCVMTLRIRKSKAGKLREKLLKVETLIADFQQNKQISKRQIST